MRENIAKQTGWAKGTLCAKFCELVTPLCGKRKHFGMTGACMVCTGKGRRWFRASIRSQSVSMSC